MEEEVLVPLHHVDGWVLTWGTPGTWMHDGRKAIPQRACDALITYHLPKHCCTPCTPFHENCTP